MSDEVVLNYFDFSVYLWGGVLILNALNFFKVDLWMVLFSVFIWFLFILLLYFKGRRLLWLEGERICFRRKFKTVSFDRGVVKVSITNCIFKPVEVVVNMPGHREVFLLPRFIPEEQREFVIKMIEGFCLEHNITYL
ncbi:hypothetical protein [Pseudomonas brassicacearum]|uniref:Uncharacterized protein n=1 Tax=Pseudomonas brassicacearum TaxID=930166 RepID=A0AAJ3FV25_9PSED|nr:hypothetical protein [Pseudomonas brassicacearum]NUT80848.1 hypothetical protein [Pseudomonas brassicacearum]